jgi:2-hydroxychromene-2-carboxylate isomerase
VLAVLRGGKVVGEQGAEQSTLFQTVDFARTITAHVLAGLFARQYGLSASCAKRAILWVIRLKTWLALKMHRGISFT